MAYVRSRKQLFLVMEIGAEGLRSEMDAGGRPHRQDRGERGERGMETAGRRGKRDNGPRRIPRRGARDAFDGPPTMYVTGFLDGVTARELGGVFEPLAEVILVNVCPPRQSDGHQYGFVAFRRVADLEGIVRDCQEGMVLGADIALDRARGITVSRAKKPLVMPEDRDRRGRGDRGDRGDRRDRGGRGDHPDRSDRGKRNEAGSGPYSDPDRHNAAASAASPLPPPSAQDYDMDAGETLV